MTLKIVILEDNKDRQAVMSELLADRFYQYEARFFRTAPEAIQFLHEHLAETIVISLDHDLELTASQNGQIVDSGTGREIADYLASKAPVCTVVIHSTNSAAVLGMEMVLHDARWETIRVIPWGDMEWISSQWFRTIRRAILRTARDKIQTK
jgi:CheY-like chemotaxis protein